MGLPVDHDQSLEAALYERAVSLLSLRNQLAASGLDDTFTIRALELELARVCVGDEPVIGPKR